MDTIKTDKERASIRAVTTLELTSVGYDGVTVTITRRRTVRGCLKNGPDTVHNLTAKQ